MQLAPFIRVGSRGLFGEDGFIEKGRQNLPGNRGHQSFNLPGLPRERISDIDGHDLM
jgi:hypothetical protein